MTVQVTNLVSDLITLTQSNNFQLKPFQSQRFEIDTPTAEMINLDTLKRIQAEVVAPDQSNVIGSTSNYSLLANVRESDLRDGQDVILNGITSAFDGTGGRFKYSATSSATADGGVVLALPIGRLFREGCVTAGGVLLAFGRAVDPCWWVADRTGLAVSHAAWTSAANFIDSIGGGTITASPGVYKFSDEVKLGDNTIVDNLNRERVKIVVDASIGTTKQVFSNKNVNNTSGALTGRVRIFNTTFDGSARVFPAYLSKLDGTPIADPKADYRVGGALAPTTFATISLTVSGGAVTGASVTAGGSGYVVAPVVWITGDGVGAFVTTTISGGVVTGATVTLGGKGYTTATAECAGGGAAPDVALYAANRRNPNFAMNTACISLSKCSDPEIAGCRFIGYAGNVINDNGCDNLDVHHNKFENCGQNDYVGNPLWSQSHGTVTSPPVYFRLSTNTKFRNNNIVGCKRSVCLIGGRDARVFENDIDGWGESCMFIAGSAISPRIYRNNAKNGIMTDIVCSFVEGGQVTNVRVEDNDITDVAGNPIYFAGSNSKARRNTLTVTKAFAGQTLPFGPYSERVGFNVGLPAIAGTQDSLLNNGFCAVTDIDSDPLNAPDGCVIEGNTVIDPSSYLNQFISFNKGASKAIGDLAVINNDVTQAPALKSFFFDPVLADLCLNPNKRFRCRGNQGHVSDGSVTLRVQHAANATGLQKLTFGFRPSTLLIMVKANATTDAKETWAFFGDDVSKNPGTTGGTNTTGVYVRHAIASTPSVVSGDGINGGLSAVGSDGVPGNLFNASAVGFSSDGWSYSISACTAAVNIVAVAIP